MVWETVLKGQVGCLHIAKFQTSPSSAQTSQSTPLIASKIPTFLCANSWVPTHSKVPTFLCANGVGDCLKVQVGCLQKYPAKRLMMTQVIYQERSSSISVLPNKDKIVRIFSAIFCKGL